GAGRPESAVGSSARWDAYGTGPGPDGKPRGCHGAVGNAPGTAGWLELATVYAAARPAPAMPDAVSMAPWKICGLPSGPGLVPKWSQCALYTTTCSGWREPFTSAATLWLTMGRTSLCRVRLAVSFRATGLKPRRAAARASSSRLRPAVAKSFPAASWLSQP